jgi:hypothetical protein
MSEVTLAAVMTRLASTEQELVTVRRELEALRQRSPAWPSRRALGPAAVAVMALSAVLLMRTGVTEAQGAGQTVRAPFVVLDAAGKRVFEVTATSIFRGARVLDQNQKPMLNMLVEDGGALQVFAKDGVTGTSIQSKDDDPEIVMRDSAKKKFVYLGRTGSNLRGPVEFSDNAEKTIAVVQDATTTKGKDSKEITVQRGVHVMNSAGTTIAKIAADATGNGYMLAHDVSGKTATAALMITPKGAELSLAGGGKVRASMTSSDGLSIFNEKGATVGSFSASKDHGYLELNDGSGLKMVEGGVSNDQRGYLMVSPWQPRVDAAGDPSVLIGSKKK